jgi:ankyrin repeat protein
MKKTRPFARFALAPFLKLDKEIAWFRAISAAVQGEDAKLIELLERDPSVNRKDWYGRSITDYATVFCRPETARLVWSRSAEQSSKSISSLLKRRGLPREIHTA